jgi:hypothetical protein
MVKDLRRAPVAVDADFRRPPDAGRGGEKPLINSSAFPRQTQIISDRVTLNRDP